MSQKRTGVLIVAMNLSKADTLFLIVTNYVSNY